MLASIQIILSCFCHHMTYASQAGSMGAKSSWRREVVEGLARAACNLPADLASAAGLQIAGPIIAPLDSLASGRCSGCSLSSATLCPKHKGMLPCSCSD